MSDYHYRDTPDRNGGGGGGRPRRGSRGGDGYYQQDGPRGGGGGYRDDEYYERPPPPPPRGGGGRGGRGGRGGGYDERRGPYGGGRGGGDYEEGGRGGKRRRSASPPPRGGGRRGDPGDDYYDSRPPPPGRNGGYDDGPRYRDDRREGYSSRPMNPDAAPFDPAAMPARPMPTLEAPHQLPYPVTYRYFSDWFAQSSPPSLASSPEALADAWKKYEADLLRREAKAAFEGLKGWTWFKEKYAPGVGAKDGEGGEEERRRRERRGKQRVGREREWVERVERGELEGLSFDFDESSVPRRPAILPNAAHLAATGQSPVKPSSAANGDASSSSTAKEEKDPDTEEVKKENGAAQLVKDENGDASMSTAEEKPAVTPKKEDSASLPPTTDKKEGEGEEEKKPAGPASAEMVLVPGRPDQIALSRVPGEVGVGELEALFLPLPGFLRLSLSEPAPHLRFIRLAWATFDSPASAQSALEEIQSKWVEPKEEEVVEVKKTENGGEEEGVKKEGAEEGGDEEMKDSEAAANEEKKEDESAATTEEDTKPKEPTPLPPSPYSIPVLGGGIYNLSAPGIAAIQTDAKEARVRAAPALMSTRERVRVDLENVERVVGELERRAAEEASALGETGEEEEKKGSEVLREKREEWEREVEERKEGLEEEEYQKAMAAVAKRALDLCLSYLRSVHFSCYYCCVVCDSPEQLADMCPKHLRRADDGGNATRRQNEAAWAEGFDKRLPLLFPRDSLDVRDFGGESRDEELFRLVTPHVKQEEEGKFRCKECNKLFSARKFVEKHISLKHPDFIGDALDQVAFFNNYVLDPSRIPLAPFQCQSYLPSILAPPPPPPRPFNNNTNSRSGGGALADRIGPKRPRIEPRSESNAPKGPPPPPPQGKSLDPRAGRGVSSYADLDGPGGGGEDIVLQY